MDNTLVREIAKEALSTGRRKRGGPSAGEEEDDDDDEEEGNNVDATAVSDCKYDRC